MHDPFLNDIYTSNDAEEYFSQIVGEEMRWLSNSWDASHMNVQEKTGLGAQSFTSLKADLFQDINGCFAFGRCLNGTFP